MKNSVFIDFPVLKNFNTRAVFGGILFLSILGRLIILLLALISDLLYAESFQYQAQEVESITRHLLLVGKTENISYFVCYIDKVIRPLSFNKRVIQSKIVWRL